MPPAKSLPDIPPSEAYTNLNSLRLCKVITGLDVPGEPNLPYTMPNERTTTRIMDQLLDIGMSSFFLSPPADRYAKSLRTLVGRSMAASAQFIQTVIIDTSGRGKFSLQTVDQAIDDCLVRAGAEQLDLLLLDWKDPSDLHFLDTLAHLHELSRDGKIRQGGVGVVDFSVQQLETTLGQGIPVACNCVELSVIDQQAKNELLAFCSKNRIGVIARNPLANGLLTSRWLGVPEPVRSPSTSSITAKLEPAGGWGMVQECLFCLSEIADKHRATVAQIATRWVLQQGVDAVVFNVDPELLGEDEGGEAQDCIQIGNVFLFSLDDVDLDDLFQITKHQLR